MRVELENSRDQTKLLQQQLHRRLEEASLVESRLSAMKGHEEHIRDLQAQVAKERVQRQAAERRIAAERESSQHKTLTFEGELRQQIRNLEGELEREREARSQADARMHAASAAAGRGQAGASPQQAEQQRQLAIERDALAAHNAKYEGEVRELRSQMQEVQGRLARAIQQRDEHTYTQTHSYTRAMEENKMLEDKVRGLEQSLGDVTRRLSDQASELAEAKKAVADRPPPAHAPQQSWSIPDLQAPAGASLRAPSPPLAAARDVEIHQNPATNIASSHEHAHEVPPTHPRAAPEVSVSPRGPRAPRTLSLTLL